jgi:hypothetical protein
MEEFNKILEDHNKLKDVIKSKNEKCDETVIQLNSAEILNLKLYEEFINKTWKLYCDVEGNVTNLDKINYPETDKVNPKELWRWIKSLLKIRSKIESEYQERYINNPLISYIYNLMESLKFQDVNLFKKWLDEKLIKEKK